MDAETAAKRRSNCLKLLVLLQRPKRISTAKTIRKHLQEQLRSQRVRMENVMLKNTHRWKGLTNKEPVLSGLFTALRESAAINIW
jgi:hypothetical protein